MSDNINVEVKRKNPSIPPKNLRQLTKQVAEIEGTIDDINESVEEAEQDVNDIKRAINNSDDFVIRDNKFKRKNKAYNPAQYSGLGEIYLEKNNTFLGREFDEFVVNVDVPDPTAIAETFNGIVYDRGRKEFLAYELVDGERVYYAEWIKVDKWESANDYVPEAGYDFICEADNKAYRWTEETTPDLIETVAHYGNVLKQEMVNFSNTIYHIQYDYTLIGKEITIPEGCLLEFEGGTISNGILIGQNTILVYNQPLNDILTATLEGTWRHESGVKADEEDITDTNGELKFKDKAYIPANYSGLGRKYLRKNIVNGVNTLTQEMVSDANTIYVIQYNFTLDKNITIPEDCVLKFEGGSIGGSYTITGQNTAIEAGLVKIFGTDVAFNGTWKLEGLYPEWFGAAGDNTTDDSVAISKAIAMATSMAVNKVKFSSSQYYIYDGIIVEQGAVILEGVQCNLREDNRFNESIGLVRSSATSLIANHTTNSVITFGENVTHPIEIYNINFEGSQTNNAIDFKSEFDGPTWPFVVENCRFHGFDKAFFVSANKPFNISVLQITKCAFHVNNYCLYFDDNNSSTGARDYIATNYTFELCFNNNRAHQNTHIVRGTTTNGIITICDNNIEGGLETYIDGTSSPYDHILILTLGENAELILKNNHCEVMSKKLLRLSVGRRGAFIDVEHNDFTTDLNNIAKNRVDVVQNLSILQIKTLEVDSLYFNGPIKFLNDFERCLFNNPKLFLTGINSIILSDKPLDFSSSPIIPNFEETVSKYENGIFVGKELYGNNPTNRVQSQFTVDNTKNYLAVVMFKIIFAHDNTEKFRITDDYNWTRYVYVEIGFPASKYFYYICNLDNLQRNNVIFRDMASPLYVGNICYRLFEKGNTDLNLLDVIYGIETPNVIDDNSTPINKVTIGCSVFTKDINKNKYWNGTAWVDATGVIAGTPTSGTFTNKPTVATNNIPVGFKYFCTDKQTTEGTTDGIEIIHKGNDVWVDALGRTVS